MLQFAFPKYLILDDGLLLAWVARIDFYMVRNRIVTPSFEGVYH